MTISALDKDTVKLLTTTQIITSVATAAKELIENALDASATNIEINLRDTGCTSIEVKDDGCGISKVDASYMALSSYTSKIFSFTDLGSLETYGFRGEALHALSAMSDLTIISKTEKDDVAMTYTIDHHGCIVKSEPCHRATGTTVQVRQLFKQIPVRRQIISNSKKANQDVKLLEFLVKCYGMCKYCVHISFKVDGNIIFAKPGTATFEEAVNYILGKKVTSNMNWIDIEDSEIKLKLMVPSKNAFNVSEVFHSGAQFVFVNNRPIKHKELEKTATKTILEALKQDLSSRKKPIFLVYILTNSRNIDVNLEPNKTFIVFKNQHGVLDTLDKHLKEFYGIQREVSNENMCEELLNDYQDYTKILSNGSDREIEWPACKKRKVQVKENEDRFIAEDELLSQKPNNNLVQNFNSGSNFECNTSGNITISEEEGYDSTREEFTKHFNVLPSINLSDSESNDSQNCLLVSRDKDVPCNSINEIIKENTSDSPLFEFTPPSETFSQLPVVDLGDDFDWSNNSNCDAENNKKEDKLPNASAQLSQECNKKKLKTCITLEEWSKGHVSGLKGGTNVNLHTVTETGDITIRESLDGNVCRGFLKFSKHIKLQVTERNPSMSAPQIADAMTKLWKKLSPEERGYYRDLARDEEIERHGRKQKMKDKSLIEVEKNKNRLLNLFERMKTKTVDRKEKLVMRATVPWHIDIGKVTQSNLNNSKSKNTKFIVGIVDSNLWIVHKSSRIWILDKLHLTKELNVCGTSLNEEDLEHLLKQWFATGDDQSILYPIYSLAKNLDV